MNSFFNKTTEMKQINFSDGSVQFLYSLDKIVSDQPYDRVSNGVIVTKIDEQPKAQAKEEFDDSNDDVDEKPKRKVTRRGKNRTKAEDPVIDSKE